MISLVRQVALLAAAAVLSWWLFLWSPEPLIAPAPHDRTAPPAVVTPRLELARPATPPAAEEIEAVVAPEAPPPPEVGAPEGSEDAALPAVAHAEPEPEPAAENSRPSSEELMEDDDLIADANREFTGELRHGFATVLLAAPEEQLDIARFFGEELVLVPREALDPDADRPHYFRLSADGAPRVETVGDRPPLERYRQYRDLFDYEYARLPAALRELRRSVLTRSEIYVFAALIPAREWAVVVGRRREALAASGREVDDVRRFVLRYERRADSGFDVRVEEIVFSDGTRFHPNSERAEEA